MGVKDEEFGVPSFFLEDYECFIMCLIVFCVFVVIIAVLLLYVVRSFLVVSYYMFMIFGLVKWAWSRFDDVVCSDIFGI